MKKNRIPEYLRLLGANIRKRRRKADLTQGELAARVGCHRNYVGMVERAEHNISVDMLHRFAVALGCSMRDLFGAAR